MEKKKGKKKHLNTGRRVMRIPQGATVTTLRILHKPPGSHNVLKDCRLNTRDEVGTEMSVAFK